MNPTLFYLIQNALTKLDLDRVARFAEDEGGDAVREAIRSIGMDEAEWFADAATVATGPKMKRLLAAMNTTGAPTNG